MQDLPDPTNSGVNSNSTSTGGLTGQIPDPNNAFSNQPAQDPTLQSISGGIHKEVELPIKSETPTLDEAMPQMEIAPELEEIGVEVKSETINLPPDISKMGVTAVGAAQPVMTPTVNLPITDEAVLEGKKANAFSSVFWLALWCIRQLKKAHLNLRKISGKVVRERE